VLSDSTAGRLQWASALLPRVLVDAEARRQQRETTDSAVLGITTGLCQLDHLLGGLNEGLYLLAGPPDMGKTTLTLQLATAATRDVPVVVVTFEHASQNLTLRQHGRVGSGSPGGGDCPCEFCPSVAGPHFRRCLGPPRPTRLGVARSQTGSYQHADSSRDMRHTSAHQ